MSEVIEGVTSKLVVYTLDERMYGLPLDVVGNVFRIVEITDVPGMPDCIRGVINVHGAVMAVINMRCRMGIKDKPETLSDQLIIVKCSDRSYALIVDSVRGVEEIEGSAVTRAEEILPEDGLLSGIVKTPAGMVVLNDPEMLIHYKDDAQVDSVLGRLRV